MALAAIEDAPDVDRLGRLAYDIAKLRGRQAFEVFTGWLAGVVKGSLDRASRWKAICSQDNLPAGILPLAIAIGREIHKDMSLDEDRRAAVFTDLSNRLYDRGIYPEALAASEEAVKILRRKMDEKDPGRFEAQFADALRSYAACLWKDGAIANAVAESRESRDILQRLARLNPVTYEPLLARSLGVLCNCLTAASHAQDATTLMQQAVNIWEGINRKHPGRYAIEHAQSINNLSVCFYEMDDIKSARESVETALPIWRALAQSWPARCEPGLALALIHLSYYLRDVDDAEANRLLREAIDIYSRVAEANPAHEPDFARSLEQLAYSLTDKEQAIDALKQAVEIRRKLALARPDRAEPGLVSCLDRQLYRLDRRSDPERAVQYPNAVKVGSKTVCILLVRGKSPEGDPIYAYVAIMADKLELFMEAQQGGIFYPEDYGNIVLSGKGDPSPEVRAEMTREYDFQHDAMIDIPNVDTAASLLMDISLEMSTRHQIGGAY